VPGQLVISLPGGRLVGIDAQDLLQAEEAFFVIGTDGIEPAPGARVIGRGPDGCAQQPACLLFLARPDCGDPFRKIIYRHIHFSWCVIKVLSAHPGTP
jgi:hypothetical protein